MCQMVMYPNLFYVVITVAACSGYYLTFLNGDAEERQVLAQGHIMSKQGLKSQVLTDSASVFFPHHNSVYSFYTWNLIKVCSNEHIFSLFHLRSQMESRIF